MTEQHKEYIFEATKVYFGGYHVHSVNGELTRCKDCKHWLPHAQFGFDEGNNEYHNYCALLVPEDDDYYAFTREADEFCSRAERKDNG